MWVDEQQQRYGDLWLKQREAWLTQREDLAAKLLDYQKTNTNYFEQIELILDLTKRAVQIVRTPPREAVA